MPTVDCRVELAYSVAYAAMRRICTVIQYVCSIYRLFNPTAPSTRPLKWRVIDRLVLHCIEEVLLGSYRCRLAVISIRCYEAFNCCLACRTTHTTYLFVLQAFRRLIAIFQFPNLSIHILLPNTYIRERLLFTDCCKYEF